MPYQYGEDFAEGDELADVFGAIEVLGRAARRRREEAREKAREKEKGARLYSPLLEKPDSEVAFTNRRGGRVRVIRPFADLEDVLSPGKREHFRHSAMSLRLHSASSRDRRRKRHGFWPAVAAILMILGSLAGLLAVAFTEPQLNTPIQPKPIEEIDMFLFGSEEAPPASEPASKETKPAPNPERLHAEGTENPAPPKARPATLEAVLHLEPRPKGKAHTFFISTST